MRAWIVWLVLLAAADSSAKNAPVAALDLQRYSGKWHEIAHLPMYFQRKCVDRITATYTPRPDGSLVVVNACRTKAGAMDSARGEAVRASATNGALRVRFAPKWLSWFPAIWADYWVIDLDPEYQWAVVGGPDAKNLWILSRTPLMKRELFEQIKDRAVDAGYPMKELVMASALE